MPNVQNADRGIVYMEPDKGNYRMTKERYYTIGEIAKMYHLGVDTLRYYEEKGILERFAARMDTGIMTVRVSGE